MKNKQHQNQEMNSHLSFVEEAADGADDAGRPCTEHLQDSPGIQSSEQLLHAHSALCDFKLSLTETHKERIFFFIIAAQSYKLEIPIVIFQLECLIKFPPGNPEKPHQPK